MHELSIALSLIDTATEESLRLGARQVNAIHLKVGPLSGVVAAALQGAFEIARENSALRDSRLVIEAVPVTAYCPMCDGPRSVVSIQNVRCKDCGTLTPDILTGRELEVTAMEIVQ